MRLYLDTSALVKLYVEQVGSSMVRRWLYDADTVATSVIACVETRAAFARRHREKRISSAAHARLVSDFAADWDRYLLLEATQPLMTRAGRLAATHALRAYDAIHFSCRDNPSGETCRTGFLRFVGRAARICSAQGNLASDSA